jgi:hypothetical protein
MAAVRFLAPIALVACGVSSSRRGDDAGIDAPVILDAPEQIVDAPGVEEPPPHIVGPCDAPKLFFEDYAPSRILHVTPGAKAGDGSAGAPFGTIEQAAAVATPGTFILLAPGIHAPDQFLPNLRGTPQAPIWIGGTSTTRPVIAGGIEGIHLTRPAYVVITRLELRDQRRHAINIDDGVSYANDAHHVALVDLKVHDVYLDDTASCLRAAGVDNLAIYDSQLWRCNAGITQIGVHGAVIARNAIFEVLLHAIQVRGGSTDIDIRQNRIHAANSTSVQMGGDTEFAAYRPPLSKTVANADARRVRAFNNLVTGTTYAGFVFQGCTDCLVAHNLIYGSVNTLVRIASGTPSQNGYTFELTRNGRVINNSFVFDITSQHVEVAPFTNGSSFTFANNLWYSYTNPQFSTPYGLPVTETGSVIGLQTGYTQSPFDSYCWGPEANAAASLPEIDGTFEGYCRGGTDPTIGPKALGLGACPL